MTPETETASPAAEINGGDSSDTTITRASETSEPNSRKGETGRGRGGCTRRGGHQGRGGRGRHFNRPAYTSLIRNFKGEVEDFGAVLGTTSEQREAKDRYKKFSEKLKQYILRVFQNNEDVIVLVRYIKDHTIVFNTSRPTVLSEEDEKDLIMVMIQTEEIKQFVKKSSTLWQNIIKLYGIIWGHSPPALQSELEGDPEYFTKSPIYNCLWLSTKVNMCTSGIDHT